MISSSQSVWYSPLAGSSQDHEKTPNVTKETPASRISTMSSGQVAPGHCSGL